MSRLHPADERRAMFTFAHAHGIAFSVEPSRFMPNAIQFMIGASPRRIVHSPARAWSFLRAAAAPRPAPRRKPSARVRASVLGIRVLP